MSEKHEYGCIDKNCEECGIDEDGLGPEERAIAQALWDKWPHPSPAVPAVHLTEDPRKVAKVAWNAVKTLRSQPVSRIGQNEVQLELFEIDEELEAAWQKVPRNPSGEK